MRILSWNICGLNNRGKQKYIRHEILKEKLDIVLLQEIMLGEKIVSQIASLSWK